MMQAQTRARKASKQGFCKMSKSSKVEAQEQRRRIVELFNQNKSYSQIQAVLGCSRNTIAKVKAALLDPERDPIEDAREDNGRPGMAPHTRQAILDLREETGFGSLLMWAMMKNDPTSYGLASLEELPSVATIGRVSRAENRGAGCPRILYSLNGEAPVSPIGNLSCLRSQSAA